MLLLIFVTVAADAALVAVAVAIADVVSVALAFSVALSFVVAAVALAPDCVEQQDYMSEVLKRLNQKTRKTEILVLAA